MIVSVGTDLVRIERLAAALARHGSHFAERILAPAEREEFFRATMPERLLAKRFAAKEAFAKAWGTGLGASLGWQELWVAHDARGRPFFAFAESLAARLAAADLRAHLSLADEREYAVAFVVLERSEGESPTFPPA
ncbi:holo-ACP synthase [Tepidiphilus margaritifer]|uniref:holo-ACP synthase n=1 Tax=Tepidiphilus margaritifer TaxID=203471 RepID=UPI00042A3FBA|nr:holo-ACP synthase [Tepidiphilus margaritifer]